MAIFDCIRHRQRLRTVQQAAQLAGKDPAKLQRTVQDYLESKPKERRLAAGEVLLTETLHRAPAPRQAEVARALVPGLCQTSTQYAAGLRLAQALDVTRMQAIALALGKRLAFSGSSGSYSRFYKVLNGALVNEISAYRYAELAGASALHAYADFITTPTGHKYWELTLGTLSNFKPITFERQIDASRAANRQEAAAVAMLKASHRTEKTSFVEQVVRPYTKNMTLEEMATCTAFFSTPAARSVDEAMEKVGEYWKDEMLDDDKATPLRRTIHAIVTK